MGCVKAWDIFELSSRYYDDANVGILCASSRRFRPHLLTAREGVARPWPMGHKARDIRKEWECHVERVLSEAAVIGVVEVSEELPLGRPFVPLSFDFQSDVHRFSVQPRRFFHG